MANAKNNDFVTGNAVSKRVGPQDWKFVSASANRAAGVRKYADYVCGRGEYTLRDALCGNRAKLTNIGLNSGKIVQRKVGPDYSPHFGRGNSFGVPQESSQRFTASCETTRPAAKAASASSKARASAASSICSKRDGSGCAIP
jgi:hypothetical protein